MERKIGEIFKLDRRKFQIVENSNYDGCAFYNGYKDLCMNIIDEITDMCCYNGKNAIFKEV